MNRQIKYRGKTLFSSEKRSESWVYGFYFQMVGNGGVVRHVIKGLDGFAHYIDPDTLGEFTGMCCADGEEIYEGDVLEYTDENGITYHRNVVFHGGAFCQEIQTETKTFYNPLRNHQLQSWKIVNK